MNVEGKRKASIASQALSDVEEVEEYTKYPGEYEFKNYCKKVGLERGIRALKRRIETLRQLAEEREDDEFFQFLTRHEMQHNNHLCYKCYEELLNSVSQEVKK